MKNYKTLSVFMGERKVGTLAEGDNHLILFENCPAHSRDFSRELAGLLFFI